MSARGAAGAAGSRARAVILGVCWFLLGGALGIVWWFSVFMTEISWRQVLGAWVLFAVAGMVIAARTKRPWLALLVPPAWVLWFLTFGEFHWL